MPETGRLRGKAALISGAASGIGRETARLFAREGAEVFLADIDLDKGAAAAAEIGGSACFVPLNVTQEHSWSAALEIVLERVGRLDVLVNSAGIWLDGDFTSYALSDWQRTMDVNATGTFLGCRFAVEAMKVKGNSGAIVNVCSIYGNIAADDAVATLDESGHTRLFGAERFREVRPLFGEPGRNQTIPGLLFLSQKDAEIMGDPFVIG